MTAEDRYDLAGTANEVGKALTRLCGEYIHFGIHYSKPDERNRQRVAMYDTRDWHGESDVTEMMQPAQLDRCMRNMLSVLEFMEREVCNA